MRISQLLDILTRRPALLFAGLGALFFLPGLGAVHLFDWDEINFAEAAREMILLDDYLRVHVRFLPFWEKPPLFFWLQVFAMKSIGIGEYAARLPNAICGILTLGILVRIGTTLYNVRFGIFWALCYLGSVLPHLYFKSGIIDPWFNLFIFLGLYFFILGYWKKKKSEAIILTQSSWLYTLFGGFILGLAILTKGPVAALIVGLVGLVYLVSQRFRLFIPPSQAICYGLMALIPFVTWLGIETWQNGSWFIKTFTEYQIRLMGTQDAGHGGFPGYHIVVLLIGCFPASIFALKSMWGKLYQKECQADFRFWMQSLFWVVLILFSIVQSKIVHYSSLCYFPLTYFAALTLYRLDLQEIVWSKVLRWGLYAIGGLFVLVCLSAPILATSLDFLKPLYQNDPTAIASIEADVAWTGWEFLPGLVLMAILFISDRFLRQNQSYTGAWILFAGTALFVTLALTFYVQRVEGYSQRAAIEHWQSLQGIDCYVTTFGYKSYAPHFYSDAQVPDSAELAQNKDWLLYGEIDKDVYITTKLQRLDRLIDNVPDIEELGRKNGFVFLRRKAVGMNAKMK